MIIPTILAIVSAIFYAATCHIDKYLISKAVKNADYRALILVSTIIAGGIMTLVYLPICSFNLSFDIPSIIILFFNSIAYVIALILYYKALDRDDTTIVTIIMLQFPVFTLLLSPLILQNQQIGTIQLIGCILIVSATIFLTYKPAQKKFDKRRLFTLFLMILCSLLYAIYHIIQRYINQEHDFSQTVLWSNITLFFVGIFILIFLRSFRKSFTKMLGSNGPVVIGLNLINEVLYSFGDVISAFASTLTSVALVSFISSGVQAFTVMIMGIFITKLFPKIEKEKITRSDIIKRTITIIICIIGLGLIEFG